MSQAFRVLGFLVAALAWGASLAVPADTCERLDAKNLTTASNPSFHERTQEAVESLRQISASLRSDETQVAAGLVERAQSSWCELKRTSEYFRVMAERQADLCQSRVAELIDRINDLYQNQKALEKTLGQLQAEFAQAAKDDELTSAEIANLKTRIRENQRDLAERERKLQELRDWWWVPGYGLYLAIRAAVDNDEARAASLIVDLDLLSRDLGKNSASVAGLRELQVRLKTQAETASWSGDSLKQMREDLHGKVGARKGTVVFFVEARSFWDQVQRINLNNVGETLSFIQDLQKDLESEVSVSLLGEEKSSLLEELERFAAIIDDNQKFLFDDGLDLCPGESAVSCKQGYSLDDGFCWSECPQGFETRDKVCVKPPAFGLVGHGGEQYEEMVHLKNELRRILQEMEELKRRYVSAPAREQDRIRRRQADKNEEAHAIAQDGFNACQSVYEGQGTCVANADGMTWRPNCKANHVMLLHAMTRQFPPPPPTPPMCIPQCPSEMADLGSTCGRAFYPPQ